MKSAFLMLLAASCLLAIDADIPSPAPTVQSAFPPGAPRGAVTVVELSGRNLQDAQSIDFVGRGVKARILSALGGKLTVELTVDANAEAGRRDYWLRTSRGVYVGVLAIGALPEIREQENNDDWRKPQPLQLPILVNGALANDDWDHFRFHAEAGQKLIFDVSAARHGSRLDANLAILDERGRELAWVDDYTIFGEPHLEYTFEKAGDYVARIGSLNGAGNYRFTVGALPFAHRALPAGLQAGTPTEITFTGFLLDKVDEAWIGDRLAKGEILSKTPTSLRARFTLPKDAKPGPALAHLSSAGKEVSLPTEIRISNDREITVRTPPAARTSALAVTPGVVLNGVITDPKQSHYFRFEGKAGETYLFRSESMKLGYHLDPTLTIYDDEGKKLAFADDPGMDDRTDEYQLDTDLSFRCEKDGVYYAAIRDGMYRGGELLVYRLSFRKHAPDFILELRDSLKSFYNGQEGELQVRVRRRGGWNAPVDVWAEGLPAHITVSKTQVGVKDSVVKDTCGVERVIDGTIGMLPVRVAEGPAGVFDFKVKARGVMDGRTVEHEAIVRYNHASVGFVYGPMQVERAQLAVTPAPKALLTVPDSAAPGSTVKIGVRRFGDLKDKTLVIRPRNLPDGLQAAPVTVAADAKDASIRLEGSAPSGARLQFEAVAEEGGAALAESSPVLVVGKQ